VKTAGLPAAGRTGVLAVALAAVVLWAGSPIATKLAVAEVDPLAVGVFRTLLGALVAGVILAAGRLPLPRTRAGRGQLAVSSLCGFVAFPLLFSLGIERTSAAHGALALAVLPLFTGLIAAVAERRVLRRRWWLGAAIALAGTFLLVDRRFGLTTPGASVEGDLLVLLSCLTASAGYVAGGSVAREVGTRAATFWSLALGGLVLLPVVPVLAPPSALTGLSADAWAALIYLGVFISIVGYMAWYWALAQGDMTRTALVQFIQPGVSLVLAAVILGEALTWPLFAAGVVIVAGVVLVQADGLTVARHR
jgi:drug/metabolite transporter (DMT)-like permease